MTDQEVRVYSMAMSESNPDGSPVNQNNNNWPYVDYETIIADPNDIHLDHEFRVQLFLSRETMAQLSSHEPVEHQKGMKQATFMAGEAILHKLKSPCTCCGSSDIVGFVHAPSGGPHPKRRIDKNAFMLIHDTVAAPHCPNPECQRKTSQNILSSLLTMEGNQPEIKMARQFVRKNFHATCDHCKKLEEKSSDFSHCARCKGVFYCSRKCQLDAWPSHKPNCKKAATTEPTSLSTSQDDRGKVMKVNLNLK